MATSVLPCGKAVVKKKGEAQKLLQVLEVFRGSAAFEVAFLKLSAAELLLLPFAQDLAHFAWPSCCGKGWLSVLLAHAALAANSPLVTGQAVGAAPQGARH